MGVGQQGRPRVDPKFFSETPIRTQNSVADMDFLLGIQAGPLGHFGFWDPLFFGFELDVAVVVKTIWDPILEMVGEFTTKILAPISVGIGMFTGATGF